MRKFEINQLIHPPSTVCESRKARIVGYEWGPDSKVKVDRTGWVYWLVEEGREGAWVASEGELLQWEERTNEL